MTATKFLIVASLLTATNGFAAINDWEIKLYKESIQEYDKAFEFNPDDAWTCNNRGIVHADNQQYAAALQDFDKAKSLGYGY